MPWHQAAQQAQLSCCNINAWVWQGLASPKYVRPGSAVQHGMLTRPGTLQGGETQGMTAHETQSSLHVPGSPALCCSCACLAPVAPIQGRQRQCRLAYGVLHCNRTHDVLTAMHSHSPHWVQMRWSSDAESIIHHLSLGEDPLHRHRSWSSCPMHRRGAATGGRLVKHWPLQVLAVSLCAHDDHLHWVQTAMDNILRD